MLKFEQPERTEADEQFDAAIAHVVKQLLEEDTKRVEDRLIEFFGSKQQAEKMLTLYPGRYHMETRQEPFSQFFSQLFDHGGAKRYFVDKWTKREFAIDY